MERAIRLIWKTSDSIHRASREPRSGFGGGGRDRTGAGGLRSTRQDPEGSARSGQLCGLGHRTPPKGGLSTKPQSWTHEGVAGEPRQSRCGASAEKKRSVATTALPRKRGGARKSGAGDPARAEYAGRGTRAGGTVPPRAWRARNYTRGKVIKLRKLK